MSMIQLTRNGVTNTSDLVGIRDEFAQEHTARLPGLLADDITARILHREKSAEWEQMSHKGIGKELVLRDGQSLNLLQFLMNSPGFLAIMREITGFQTITHFSGRIYRMFSNQDQHFDWHSDDIDIPGERRLVGMSINLSEIPYSGGVFHLRNADSKELLRTLPNRVLGDAILFRISDSLEHLVSPLEGSEPKTAYAGWFNASGSDFFSSVKQSRSSKIEEEKPYSCD